MLLNKNQIHYFDEIGYGTSTSYTTPFYKSNIDERFRTHTLRRVSAEKWELGEGKVLMR